MGFDLGEWLDFLHALHTTYGELLVFDCSTMPLGDFMIRQSARDFRWYPHY